MLLAPYTHRLHPPTHCQYPPPEVTFVVTDEPALTHHYHPESIVYFRAHSWCYAFHGFGQIYNDKCPSLWCCPEYFHCPRNPLCSAYSSLPCSSLPQQPLKFLFALPFLECHRIGTTQYVAFSGWLLSLSDMLLRLLHVFSWLDSSFLFSTESFLLSCYSTVYLSLFTY